MGFDVEQMRGACERLARGGVWIGTSSWKYPGWRGQLYTDDRYIYRGTFSEGRFDRLCLSEYATAFKSVSVDASYYRFPERSFLEPMFAQVPEDFLFAFKVTGDVTLKRFPNLPRYGELGGRENPDFLNVHRFVSEFLGPCEPFRQRIGLLMFEFTRFQRQDFERGRDFAGALDTFLRALPSGWNYGVEIRNRTFLEPEYLEVLARNRVAHLYNSWHEMPPLEEQYSLPGTRTVPELMGARLLLRPGRRYEEAVRLFSPYNRVKDPYPEGRAAGAQLIRDTLATGGKTRLFIYVNNRFEGNALETIAAMVEAGTRGLPEAAS